jgi:hypothetical protein
MIRATTYGKGRNALAKAMFERADFITGGSFKGERIVHPFIFPGKLNEQEREQLATDLPSITYVVWSYATPIAWVRKDGSVYTVAQRFSPTTSKHQGMLHMLTHDMRR